MSGFASYFQSWLPAGTTSGPHKPASAPSQTNVCIGTSGCGPKIWPVAPETVQELRKGVAYNMKVVIRGLRGTGKTALFSRLCNLPIQTATYTPSNEISAGTIRVVGRGCAPHEGTKVDVWDVVDEGQPRHESATPAVLPSGQPIKNEQLAALAALPADARYVDVYKGCHFALFLVDPRRYESLAYAVDQARRVPHNICVYFILNFSDIPESAHVITAHDMHVACREVRRTCSPFILSIVEGHVVPGNLSIGAAWTALSATTGAGMRQLYMAFNVPISVLRAAELERQLESLYRQMQWPSAHDALTGIDGSTSKTTTTHDTHENVLDDGGDEAGDGPVLRMAHRRTDAPKRPAAAQSGTTDRHGINADFFGSSSGSDSEGEESTEQRTVVEKQGGNGQRTQTRKTPLATKVATCALVSSPSTAVSASGSAVQAKQAAVASHDVAALVSDRHGPGADFFDDTSVQGDTLEESTEEAGVASEGKPCPSHREDKKRLVTYTMKPLATQRVTSRASRTDAQLGHDRGATRAAPTVDVASLAAQMEAALGTLTPEKAHHESAKRSPDRAHSHKASRIKKTPTRTSLEPNTHSPAAHPVDDDGAFEVLTE